MVISNAKYNKKHGSTRNKAFVHGFDDDGLVNPLDSGTDIHDVYIPRYEELTFLNVDELTK
jgi:hypothetical protein